MKVFVCVAFQVVIVAPTLEIAYRKLQTRLDELRIRAPAISDLDEVDTEVAGLRFLNGWK